MSALALKLCFNLNKYYLKPLNNNLTIKRTVQRYNNSNRKTQYFKWFIYFEIASLAGAYLVWNRMNHSQDFRLYMSKNYPIILEGYYSIGETVGNIDIRNYDNQCWKNQKLENNSGSLTNNKNK